MRSRPLRPLKRKHLLSNLIHYIHGTYLTRKKKTFLYSLASLKKLDAHFYNWTHKTSLTSNRGKIETTNTQIKDRSFSWLGTGTSIKKWRR
jgi:hypothetical protein